MARTASIPQVYLYRNGSGENRLIEAKSMEKAYHIATGQPLAIKIATAREMNVILLSGGKVEREETTV